MDRTPVAGTRVMRLAASTIFIAWLSTTGCIGRAPVVIGSKDFTEQILLGEIAAQQFENTLHIKVERRLDLGGTMLAHLALVNGQIDLYPEYTGTAASAVLKQPLDTDPKRVFERVSHLYEQRYRLRWMPSLGFEDSFAMAVRSEDAKRLNAPTLSAASARGWRLGIGFEFLTRPDGLSRLDSIYKPKWEGLPSTMSLGLLYRALERSQIDMAAANTTDGPLMTPAITILADDRKAFPPYQACFVVREDALRSVQGLKAALDRLSGTITAEQMRAMNRRVDIDHVSVVRVAADFLSALNRYNRSGDAANSAAATANASR